MKSLLLSLAISCSVNLNAQTTAIPDVNFEQALIDLGYDSVIDGQVTTANITGIQYLFVGNNLISDLTGIEGFTSLDTLDCSGNALTSLDVSQNTALTRLDCEFNDLSSLDVSQNTALTYLKCNMNFPLSTLDISGASALETLITGQNLLTVLDASQNTNLVHLDCRACNISDLSTHPNLLYLNCQFNELTSLDVSQNTALEHLQCSSNQLISLDISQCTALTSLYCEGNELTCLNVKNGNNINTQYFKASFNPNLTCIEADDSVWATSNWTYLASNIDLTASFSTDCNNACSMCPPTFSEIGVTECDSYTWLLNGTTYTNSTNTPTVTLTNSAGCDSIVTLNLTINNNTGTDVQITCDAYTWIDGNTYVTDNNTATWTLTNAAGCDSLITLDLTINPIPDNTCTQVGSLLTANQTGATYQWLDCDNNNSVINGEISQSYTPAVTGNYAVEVTLNGCVDTSACMLVDYTGLNELDIAPKQLIKTVDLLGRETQYKPNTPLIYYYSDGSTERVFKLEE